MKTIPSNLYPKVLDLINETYADKMDSIESAQVEEDGTIEAIAIDEGERFVIRYDGEIEIKALNESEKPRTAKFAAGKARNCKTGISCGNSCISKTKACRKKGTSGQAEKAKEITALVWQPGKGSPKEVSVKARENTAAKDNNVPDLGDRERIGELLKDRKFHRSRFKDFGVTKDDLKSVASVDKIYKDLSKQYHPDQGGSTEQMQNLNKLRGQMLAIAEMNEYVATEAMARKAKREAAKAKKAAKAGK